MFFGVIVGAGLIISDKPDSTAPPETKASAPETKTSAALASDWLMQDGPGLAGTGWKASESDYAGNLSGGNVVRSMDPLISKAPELVPGDILLEMDGMPFDRARLGELYQDTGQLRLIRVRFVRDGREFETVLQLR